MKPLIGNYVPNFSFLDFCWWYLKTGPWTNISGGLKTFSLNSGSWETVVFNYKNYQVELYQIDFWIPPHCHPYCDTLSVPLTGLTAPVTLEQKTNLSSLLVPAGSLHGGLDDLNRPTQPYLLLVLQHWLNSPPVSHISLCGYEGPPLTDLHLQAVKTHFPELVTVKDNRPWIVPLKA